MGLFDRIKKAFTGEDPIVEQQNKEDAQEEKNILEKYDKGVEKTRKSFSDRINELFAGFREVDEEFFDDLEETLITSDVGFDMTIALSDALREEIQLKGARNGEEVKNLIVEKMIDIYDQGGEPDVSIAKNPDGPTVVLFVGVNGVGKTTTIGKYAYQLKQAGHKVLLAAGDTFRAGAIEQLEEWGKRVDVPVISGKAHGDPASVAFDAVKEATNGDYDYLLIDTAGRLQNKVNLMNELEKMKRIIQREIPQAPHETLLVLDATTGQNALIQAKEFDKTVDISGLVLTKLDGTAKGGVIFAIRYELDLPVKLIGLGEGLDDLQVFEAEKFIYQLIKDVVEVQN
ncbi:signal recognition particle-docking protein FtsY [Aerococcus kribbianus]|uniref:Signal recognition particle receptor FtsY n=1 Tax=Aerococcus kribbianus TaxID=2999064 RepID=A0A9X3FNS8_9LACT|nr:MULTISPECIES: signal recognition particle-docking protein FtsY [unclassified Aerococcus]MCZ0717158.1 signal recognition particle-docking protein FtsY [Aerococcus sp. YH-aer221]MCZ0725446.1 signal recognition particle-docking protein FtsY [Aerococcus sp. YH-aer222]